MPIAPITPSHNSQTNTLLRFPFTALQISAVKMKLPDTWKSAEESLVKFVLTLSNIIINKQDISL